MVTPLGFVDSSGFRSFLGLVIVGGLRFYCLFSVDHLEQWGHPPDPKVQSKSFKNLMKHLDHEGTEGVLLRSNYSINFTLCQTN